MLERQHRFLLGSLLRDATREESQFRVLLHRQPGQQREALKHHRHVGIRPLQAEPLSPEPSPARLESGRQECAAACSCPTRCVPAAPPPLPAAMFSVTSSSTVCSPPAGKGKFFTTCSAAKKVVYRLVPYSFTAQVDILLSARLYSGLHTSRFNPTTNMLISPTPRTIRGQSPLAVASAMIRAQSLGFQGRVAPGYEFGHDTGIPGAARRRDRAGHPRCRIFRDRSAPSTARPRRRPMLAAISRRSLGMPWAPPITLNSRYHCAPKRHQQHAAPVEAHSQLDETRAWRMETESWPGTKPESERSAGTCGRVWD